MCGGAEPRCLKGQSVLSVFGEAQAGRGKEEV